jgi:23S rRNA pseudouridine2457 synthase
MRYFIIHKPYGMLSQFTREGGHLTLADLPFSFPKDVYPVGRLDADSEGLLVLTNDKALTHRLLEPVFRHTRTYWAQVEGDISAAAVLALCSGVEISVNGKQYRTLPATAHKMLTTPPLAERVPPIRFRAAIPTSWVQLTLIEGKNRQVRKMTAAVGFPTLRLVRAMIGSYPLGSLPPSAVRELAPAEVPSLIAQALPEDDTRL